eukprot:4965476-Amphidinium_carterae.1
MCMTPTCPAERDHVLLFLDITRAHPHCHMKRRVWVTLPAEDPRSSEEGICGILRRCLYGTRDAGREFELLTRE